MNRPIFGQRTEFLERSKHETQVQRAVAAMRQLGFGVVSQCTFCHKMPYATEDDSFPCNHRSLFDHSLRHFGLAVLNDAARIVFKQSDSEGKS